MNSIWIKALRVIPRISEEWNELDIISKWLIAGRGSVFVITLITASIGSIYDFRNGNFFWILFIIITLSGIELANATKNMLNDYVDDSDYYSF